MQVRLIHYLSHVLFMRRIAIVFLILIVALLGVLGALVYVFVYKTNDVSKTVQVELQEGEGALFLAARLEEEGVIHNKAVFRKYLSFKGIDRNIQTGVYTFQPPFSVARIADAIATPENKEVSITIIPGWDLREITAYLASKGFGTEQDIAEQIGKSAVRQKPDQERPAFIKKYALGQHIPETASLEGYLAPDTYRVFANATLDQVIEKVFAHRDSQFTEQMYRDIAASKRSVRDIIIMASVIEREVRSPQDRNIVADLFWRRYDMNWALQADSTVHYAVNKKGNVFTTKEDRQTDSPWNTYKYPGLPEGPISTPSISSIMAAIYPEKNNYWYFLTTYEGRVIYAKTLEEHNANKIHLQ